MKASAAGGPPHKRGGSGPRTGGSLNGVEQGGFAGASQPLGWVAPYLGRMNLYCGCRLSFFYSPRSKFGFSEPPAVKA